jgi:hypothetical protein
MEGRKRMDTFGKIGLAVFRGAFVIGIISCLLWIFMLLWNWLMPELFGIMQIGYWQAWGIWLLTGFMFRGKTDCFKDWNRKKD